MEDVITVVPDPPTNGAANGAPPPGSIAQQLSARRLELEADTSTDIRVPGYDMVVARYRTLGLNEMADIGLAVAPNGQIANSQNIVTSMLDTLLRANDDLLEYREDGNHVPLGYRWGSRAARELFGVPAEQVGETEREALVSIFPRDQVLLSHAGEYMNWNLGAGPDLTERVAGEVPK